MKKRAPSKIGLFLVFILFGLMGCSSQKALVNEIDAQNQGKNALIKLIVNGKDLFNKGSSNLDKGNPGLEYCGIWSTNVQGPQSAQGQAIKAFDSDIFRGNTVIWLGSVDQVSRSQGYSIKILQIELNSNDCGAFDNNILPGESGIVQTSVEDNAEVGCRSSYAIWFEIQNKTGETRSFRLDPWLIVR